LHLQNRPTPLWNGEAVPYKTKTAELTSVVVTAAIIWC
jgi:hypothetical protein